MGLHETLTGVLRRSRSADGGFGLAAGASSEPEPTAVAALALDDPDARSWLAGAQAPSGGFPLHAGPTEDSATTALVALAVDDVAVRRRALRYAVSRRAAAIGEGGGGNRDRFEAWGWTPTTYSWVEPTSRVLLAVRRLDPSAAAVEREAVELLRERHCPDGGWNYGNASVQGVDLRGYAQTTAVALHALQGGPEELSSRGLAFLRRQWRNEPGGMTLAQTLIAFRLHGETAGARAVETALGRTYERTGFLGNMLAVGWAALATGGDGLLDRLRVPS